MEALKYPITKIGFYQIEFDENWLKVTPGFEIFSFWPNFRRGLHGGWENLIGLSWEEVPNEEILENWFIQQNIND